MPTQIIVALDFPRRSPALALVRALGDDAGYYKVGHELLAAEGPDLVRALVGQGKQVFLDLKLHEIPNSVAGAVRVAGELEACMVTVHASAGSAVLRAAVQAASGYPGLKVLALTVITSLTDAELPEIGVAATVQQQVRRLAVLATGCGCHGVVASVGEAAFLAPMLAQGTLIVTPGIKLADAAEDDQKRVATPAAARQAGATHLIVGRSITRASDPAAAFRAIRADMQA